MKRAHRVYLFGKQLMGFALISFLLNSLLGWLLYQPLAGNLSAAGMVAGTDALVMAFLSAFLVAPAVLPQAEQKIRRAQLPPVARYSRSRVWVHRLPVGTLGRAAVGGLCAAVVVVPLVLSLLAFVDSPDIGLNQFVLIRACLAAAVAGLMAALFAWIGLVDAS